MTTPFVIGSALWSVLQRFGRMIRFVVAILWYTLHLWLTVRFVPTAQRPAYRAYRQMRGCQHFCRILKLRVTTRGTLPEGRAMLAVSNHLGTLDPWVLASQLPVAFVAKAEMARWPVAGWVCRTVGILFVDRAQRMQTTAFVEQVQARMHEGVCVLVFPEGTTSTGPGLLPFKTGAFEAVAEMPDGLVLPLYLHPVSINGQAVTEALRPLVTWATSTQTMLQNYWQVFGLHAVELEVRIGPPLPTAGHDRKALARLAQGAVEALMPDAEPATPPLTNPIPMLSSCYT